MTYLVLIKVIDSAVSELEAQDVYLTLTDSQLNNSSNVGLKITGFVHVNEQSFDWNVSYCFPEEELLYCRWPYGF